MATRRSEALKLVARVRRVGWPVEQMEAGGWKLFPPLGQPIQIHLSPSDVNHLATVTRELNRRGFAKAEQEVTEQEERERQERLEADRREAERRTELAGKRASALALAAGPYGPTQITLDDLLADHPAPRVFHRVLITPPMAEALLERNNPRPGAEWPNRPIRRADLIEWSTVLRTGRWRYTHQGVALDVDGRLQDGQHRLSAIADTQIPAEMMVSVGMPRDNFAVIDVGRRRSAAQVLGMVGASYSAAVASATRLIYLFDTWGAAMLDRSRERVGNDVIAEVYAKLDPENLQVSVLDAHRLRGEIGCPVAGPTAAFYVIRRAVGHDERVDGFVSALIKGTEADDRDPVRVLRRNLTRQATGVSRKLTTAQQMALIVKGWGMHVRGECSRTFYVQDGSTMPLVVVPRDVAEATG